MSSMQRELINALGLGVNENCLKDVDVVELSRLIEEDFLRTTSGQDQRIVRQRRFELLSNLKRISNPDLRRRILVGEMSIRQFVTCPVSELAPDSLRQQRLQEQKRYFKEECILMGGVLDTLNKDKHNEVVRAEKKDEDDVNELFNDKSYEDNLQAASSSKKIRLNSYNNDRLYSIVPNVSLLLKSPPNCFDITPSYVINKFVNRYKQLIMNMDIQHQLIKQAKLRIVTTT
ncbi:transcription factor S-II domain-containing protein [Cryptosporidium muris RN66]|uniref:Transcription factor S-II domain-containing protein n=1 Tax=Cryptosporidium muris (strain RN66) TaxID=441375 RepID=B6ACI6_CRYMR|nr:transcription factor S-II domain-containing protein [Cryptosporidium muris RN66]EEA05840.1 transcription factor S-II domain-containing protein [Cryptosporidium muris RN66]|eukprot:XP_002140189.1 transcription factor S-II domain-containing protein [Cryptosporidium muris RN66]